MPTIYDINFNNAAPSLLPPDKRYKRSVAWVRMLLSPLQWLRDLWFGSYRTGSTAPTWVNSAPYSKYAQVIYSNKIVYESLKNSNSDLPTVTASWRVVQQNFIGLSERLLFNGQKMVLEYAMNKWFGTTFRQPTNMALWTEIRWQLDESASPFMDGNIQIYVNGVLVVDVFSTTTGGLWVAAGASVQVVAPTFIAWSGVVSPYIQLRVANNGTEISNQTKTDQTLPFLTYTFTAAAWRVFQVNIRTNQQGVIPSTTAFTTLTKNTLPPPGASDIYISRNSLDVAVFRSGGLVGISSSVAAKTSSEFIVNAYTLSVGNNFTVHCPVAVYNALDTSLVNNEKIFRAFVDKYVPAGMTYNVITY